jgi:hypothetical protein
VEVTTTPVARRRRVQRALKRESCDTMLTARNRARLDAGFDWR